MDNNIDDEIENPDKREGQPETLRGKKVIVYSPGRSDNGEVNQNWNDYIKTW
jgi:hypothetical protein